MKILTLDSGVFELDEIDDELDENIHFWVLEYVNNSEEDTDYYLNILLFLDIFTDMKLDIQIGEHKISIPKSWSVLCADKFVGDAEIISPIAPGFNEREFSTFSLNPTDGFKADYLPIEVLAIMPETKWHLPRLENGQLLAIPLSDDPKGDCVYITNQKNYKVPDVLDIRFIT